MKKVISLVFIVFLLSSFPVFAEEGTTVLKQADIAIESDADRNYQVIEKILLSDIQALENQEIVHTFASSGQDSVDSLHVSANGQELTYAWEEGESMSRLNISLPENASGDFEYTLEYSFNLQENTFKTPLFVPMIATLGTSNIVHISYQAPEGQIIQKNSFPVINKSTGDTVENNIMNIPTHVNYVYKEKESAFHFFNYISWGVLLCLIIIVGIWFRAERNSNKGVAA
ncbi:Uncharacterised protein [Mycobacteroides abscessus subsp. abscessus]|nr:Uncharacterised protein [Mycobacteroides abscessus subsp. abscessus]